MKQKMLNVEHKSSLIYPYLTVTANGEIYSIKTNKYLKQCPASGNHLVVGTRWIKENGKMRSSAIVARVVASAWLPTPYGVDSTRYQVFHKDNNVQNNHYTNLSWETLSGLRGKRIKKPVYVFTQENIDFIHAYFCKNKRHSSDTVINRNKEIVDIFKAMTGKKCVRYHKIAKHFNFSYAHVVRIVINAKLPPIPQSNLMNMQAISKHIGCSCYALREFLKGETK